MKDLAQLEKEAKKAVKGVADEAALQLVKIKYIGRKGHLTQILRSLKNMPLKEKQKVGKRANVLKEKLERLIEIRGQEIKKMKLDHQLEEKKLDTTVPGYAFSLGHLHPITKLTRQLIDIFSSLGFEIISGPELETEWYNFDALNIPKDHPARDLWDTFWIKNQKLLLRTHTSSAQIRYMESHQPPFRIVVPGKVYRYEATNASHDIQFWQIEGLVIDKNISLAHFKSVIETVLRKLFGYDVHIRMRPSYFPFTEPSVEVDMSCVQCSGKGRIKNRNCSVCMGTGFVELMGAGMVHPQVLKNMGLNPDPTTGGWQGFAFGMGIDRLAMMKYKIPDVRLFQSSDLRFIRQF